MIGTTPSPSPVHFYPLSISACGGPGQVVSNEGEDEELGQNLGKHHLLVSYHEGEGQENQNWN